MLNEFLNKQITVPMYRYEQLIENETKYNQLFEWQHEHGNDEILKVLDNEKLKDLISQSEPTKCNDDKEDYQYEVEDLVEIVKDNGTHGNKLKIGGQYIITDIDPDDEKCTYQLENEYSNWVCNEEIKLVKKGEEN